MSKVASSGSRRKAVGPDHPAAPRACRSGRSVFSDMCILSGEDSGRLLMLKAYAAGSPLTTGAFRTHGSCTGALPGTVAAPPKRFRASGVVAKLPGRRGTHLRQDRPTRSNLGRTAKPHPLHPRSADRRGVLAIVRVSSAGVSTRAGHIDFRALPLLREARKPPRRQHRQGLGAHAIGDHAQLPRQHGARRSATRLAREAGHHERAQLPRDLRTTSTIGIGSSTARAAGCGRDAAFAPPAPGTARAPARDVDLSDPRDPVTGTVRERGNRAFPPPGPVLVSCGR